MQVGVDRSPRRSTRSSHSASGISASIRRAFSRTCSGVAAPTTTLRTAGSRSGNCSAASGSATPWRAQTSAMRARALEQLGRHGAVLVAVAGRAASASSPELKTAAATIPTPVSRHAATSSSRGCSSSV